MPSPLKIKIFLVAIVIGLAVAQPFINHPEWLQFKSQHGKRYINDKEELKRIAIFFDNLKKVEEHNKRFAEGRTTFTLTMNKYADLTAEEFRDRFNGLRLRSSGQETPEVEVLENIILPPPLPKTVDWRTKGAVTPVKDQKKCASCWAFSTTGVLESHLFLKNGSLVSLSEQNLMDCSVADGNTGCKGGYPEKGYQYVSREGIDTEEAYPYQAKDGECRFKKEGALVTEVKYEKIRSDEKALQDAVAMIGPISVCVDARNQTFHLYHTGIYYEETCRTEPDFLDHAVLVVGYGSENGTDYWLVKNSWGALWGEDGYIRMARNRDNNCGIATNATYPILL